MESDSSKDAATAVTSKQGSDTEVLLCTRCQAIVWAEGTERQLKTQLSNVSPELMDLFKLLVVSIFCNAWIPIRRLGDVVHRYGEKMIQNIDASIAQNGEDSQAKGKKYAFKSLIRTFMNMWTKLRSTIDPLQKKYAEKTTSVTSLTHTRSWLPLVVICCRVLS